MQLVDVLDRDQAFEVEILINEQKLLDLVLGQDSVGCFQTCVFGGRDEVVLRHDLLDGQVVPLQEAEVAPGENASELAVDGDRHSGDVVVAASPLGPRPRWPMAAG